MAKNETLTVSEHIRRHLRRHPNQGPKSIAEHLSAALGQQVNPGLVSNIKSAMKAKANGASRKPSKSGTSSKSGRPASQSVSYEGALTLGLLKKRAEALGLSEETLNDLPLVVDGKPVVEVSATSRVRPGGVVEGFVELLTSLDW